MVVNDNACFLVKRGESESIASKLAPTELPPAGASCPDIGPLAFPNIGCLIAPRGGLDWFLTTYPTQVMIHERFALLCRSPCCPDPDHRCPGIRP
ncbi:hypothetical protein PSJE_03860 [Pseudomonas jessenii]|nr:hypothetical protein PSJE_03860 [Pseudomonas jessenii]